MATLSKSLRAGATASIAVLAACLTAACTTTASDGEGAMASRTDWPTYNQNKAGHRFSSLTEITPANVGQLKQAWVYHMRPPGASPAAPLAQVPRNDAGPPPGQGGQAGQAPGAQQVSGFLNSQSTPLVVNGTMYLSTPYSRLVALDPATGQEKWVFQMPEGERPSLRGVEYWPGDGQQGPAIFVGARSGKLYSVDAATGRANTSFGVNGVLDLKTPEVMHTGLDKSYIVPSPPIVFENLVITGAGPGEGPGGDEGPFGPAGDTRAWDARTGRLVWTFHSVPRPGELGHETWAGDSWRNRSGVNVWGFMTIDAERGIVYMPFGTANNDRYGGDRPGDNLFGSSIVAADARTGKYLWHFQMVHHDIWDYDTQAPPTLIDVRQNGRTIPAVLLTNKTSLVFILDRVTGKPIYPIEERPVPPSKIPEEKASPTQPFPVVTEPLSRVTFSEADLYKLTPEHKDYCERLVRENNMLLANMYTPIEPDRYTVSYAGTQGGVNWAGGAYDPQRGLFVVNVNNMAQPMRLVKTPSGRSWINSGPLAGTRRFWNPETRLHCAEPPWGQLVAVDVNTGKVAWRSNLGVTDTLPEGKQNTGRPSLGGPILTASGVAFQAGTDDARFRAFETRTGRELWTTRLPAAGHSTPITYEANGKQHVAVVATGGGLLAAPTLSDSLIVYTLP